MGSVMPDRERDAAIKRITAELEAKICYAVIVAGKSASFADRAIERLWKFSRKGESPFEMIRRLVREENLATALQAARVGNYSKTQQCFDQLVTQPIDLRICEPSDLERIHGIGPKTSRFFILWTRPGEMYAALDVHILRWLGQQGYVVPRHTPSNPKLYRRLEQAFLAEAGSVGKHRGSWIGKSGAGANKSGITR
jgi:thermostable 8-oxoguanine DNA glycosylase